MAAVAPPASDQSADLLQKLSLDSQSKDLEVTDSEKKPTAYQTLANGIGKPYERSTTPFPQNFVDPMMWYFPNAYPPAGYYSGGYPGSGNEWDNYNIYANTDGVEMPPGLYGDNGSLVYYHGYYPPYSAYHSPDSPIPTVGDDGQLYGPQNYQYPSYYQSSTPNGEPFSVNQADAPQKGVSTSTGAEQVPFHVDTAKMNQTSVESFGNVNGTNASKPLKSNQNSCLGANGSYGRGGRPKDGIPSPNPWLDGSKFPDGKPKHAPVLQGANFLPGKNQNLHPLSHLTGPQHHMPTFGMSNVGFIDRSYPNNRMYSQYAHSFRTGAGFGFNGYGARLNGRGWVDGKYKPRVYGNGLFGHGIGNVDGLNELKRGPRIKGFKNQKDLEPIASGEKEQNTQSHGNDSEDNLSGKDLPESYPDAKFFIIKSYSEDDVHKSIKYGVWASTSNGNKKLDAAYHEAQTAGCPVFLFFSVNASGQFVGLAEMVGTVDFTKSVEYWQQDKWTGNFPVKWRIVKDIPNSLLKHIILENNENKPVSCIKHGEGNFGLITDIRFRPSSSFFATSSFDRTVQIWDADRPRRPVFPLVGHTGKVTSIDFHPVNSDILCSCDNTDQIRMWHVNSTSCAHVFKGGSRQVRFQPQSGDLLAAASENAIKLFDVQTNTLLCCLEGHLNEVNSICWDTSGKYMASVSEDSARIWSIASYGKPIHVLDCQGNRFGAGIFHPGYSQLLVVGSYQALQLWNPTLSNQTLAMPAHEDVISTLADCPLAGVFASAGKDEFVRIWR